MRLFSLCWGLPINGVACNEHPDDYPHNFDVGTRTVFVLVILAGLVGMAWGLPLALLT